MLGTGGEGDIEGFGDPLKWGVPYYALVSNITDRYGNRMEYEYCDVNQYECDNPETEQVIETCQNTNEKGQIKSVKLITGDDIVWTLVYVHRGFGSQLPWEYDYYDHEVDHLHKLHAIYAYEGDVDVSNLSLSISSFQFLTA